MPKINLLPWREELRQERQKEFAIRVFMAAAFGAAVVAYAVFTVNGMLDYQDRRNQFLQEQIATVDDQIEAINKLQETKQQLLSRMRVIEQLQKARPGIVHLFDELVRTVPDGVHLTSITQSGKNLTITGVAESSARVASYMRNIDASEWLATPSLGPIESNEKTHSFSFELTTQQTSPKTEEELAEEKAMGGAP